MVSGIGVGAAANSEDLGFDVYPLGLSTGCGTTTPASELMRDKESWERAVIKDRIIRGSLTAGIGLRKLICY